MRFLVIILSLLISPAWGQLMNNNILLGVNPTPSISGLFIHYTVTPYNYLSSKAGYSDTGSFNSGSNVIGLATMSADGTPNTGLSFNEELDYLIVRAGGNFFLTRDSFATAAWAAAGTIPGYSGSVTLTGSAQGLSFDPRTNEYWTTQTGDHDVARRDNTGTVLETIDLEAAGIAAEMSFNFYDWHEEILYVTGDISPTMRALRKIGGTWTHFYTSYYPVNEGGGIDFITHKFFYNGGGLSAFVPQGSFSENTPFEGLNIATWPYPTNTMAAVKEGTITDPKDGTFWCNSDQFTHGGIVNGERLWHTDPRGWYRQYYRAPFMDMWSDLWKLNGNTVTSVYSNQTLSGTNFSESPVMNFDTLTNHHNLSAWTLPSNESAELEFRCSSSAPTTTPEPMDTVVHLLELYDANQTNSGWGSTTPGAWQSTPCTDQYLQVRVKPLNYVPPAPSWTPYDLGDTLLAWFPQYEVIDSFNIANQYEAMAVRTDQSNEIWYTQSVVDPSTTPLQLLSNGSFPAVWNTANQYIDIPSGNTHMSFAPYANWEDSLAHGTVEIDLVAWKPAAGSNAIFAAASNTATNNNQLILRHSGSAQSPANYLQYTYTDNSGTVNRYGITDTSNGTPRLLSFVMGGATNEIYVNTVLQTLTINSGSNTGQSFDDTESLSNTFRMGRVQASTSMQGATRFRSVFFMRKHMSAWGRNKLYEYLQSKGEIP